jgi:hypothetical protein
MPGNDQRQKKDAQFIRERLRNFVKQEGPDSRENVRLYLRMCLKAEQLREHGWRATVRGKYQRWVVVIEGSLPLGKPSCLTSHARFLKFNTRRKISLIFCRN